MKRLGMLVLLLGLVGCGHDGDSPFPTVKVNEDDCVEICRMRQTGQPVTGFTLAVVDRCDAIHRCQGQQR